MKERIKNLWKKINLYQKEQCVIGLTLFCFMMSGFFLPSVQKQLLDNATKESSTVVHLPSEAQEESTDDTNNSEVAKPDDTPVITPPKTEDKDPEKSKDTSSTEEPKKKPSSTEKPPKNTSSAKKPKKNSSVKKTEDQKTEDNSSASDTKNNPSVPEKVWVPPVYETVHHEAVYKTVRVVICNYCEATFNNVSEFQVHKDANGG